MCGMDSAADRSDLLQQNQRLSALLEEKNVQLDRQSQRIRQLEEAILSLRHKQYGASSEVNHQQAGLFDEPEVDTEPDDVVQSNEKSIEVTAHTRQSKPRVSLPPELPREEIVYDLPDAEKPVSYTHLTLPTKA